MPVLQQDALAHHWLTLPQFGAGVAFGQITPGPFLSTAAFVGYAAAGWWGAVAAGLAVYAPSVTMTMLAAEVNPWLRRLGFVRGAIAGVMAAFTGLLASMVIVLAGPVLPVPAALALAREASSPCAPSDGTPSSSSPRGSLSGACTSQRAARRDGLGSVLREDPHDQGPWCVDTRPATLDPWSIQPLLYQVALRRRTGWRRSPTLFGWRSWASLPTANTACVTCATAFRSQRTSSRTTSECCARHSW
jgi:hypothetical protein